MLVYSKILLAKLNLANNKFDESDNLLLNALEIAEKYLIDILNKEIKLVSDSFNKIKNSISSNPSLNERLEQENFLSYVQLASKMMQKL